MFFLWFFFHLPTISIPNSWTPPESAARCAPHDVRGPRSYIQPAEDRRRCPSTDSKLPWPWDEAKNAASIFGRTWRYVEDFKQKRHLKKENPNKKGISTRNGSFANKDGHFTSKEDWRSSKTMHHWDLTSKHLGFGPETMGFKSTQSGIYAVKFCISALSASKMRFKLGSSVQHEKVIWTRFVNL